MKNNTGVYKILNIITSEFYIGSTARSFKVRFGEHKKNLRANAHPNKHLQASWNKYREKSFQFEIVQCCSPKKCIQVEQHYLDTLKPKYNKCPIAGSNLGKKMSEEQKLLLSKIKKGKPSWNKGKKFSKKHCAYLSKIRKGKKLTAAHKQNISNGLKNADLTNTIKATKKRQNKPIHCKTINKTFESLKAAAEYLKLNYCHLTVNIKKNKSVCGYEFERR